MIENTPHLNPMNSLKDNEQDRKIENQFLQTKRIANCAAEARIVPTKEAAATTLQKAWRGRSTQSNVHTIKREAIPKAQTPLRKSQWTQSPIKKLMRGPIVKGPHGPKHEIPIETIEKVVSHLIQVKDQEGLRRLANILFTGPLKLQIYQNHLDKNPSVKALRTFLNNIDTDPKKLKDTFMNAVKEWREGLDQPAFATLEDHAKLAQKSRGIDPKIDTFAELNKLDPDKEIEITHGGGEWNILEFLRGEQEGYALERGGVGLQVSPKNPETEIRSQYDYAPKAKIFFDREAILSAKIAPKYLKAAPNGYEAGLTTASIGHLKEIKVTVLATGKIWEKTKQGWVETDPPTSGAKETG